MPTERMEVVEVVCWRCNGSGIEDYRTDPPRACWGGDRTKQRTALVPEGSLTAALLRLADAAEAWMRERDLGFTGDRWSEMEQASFELALRRTKRAGG